MALEYIEGYKGTLTYKGVEFSVEAWSAKRGSNMQKITASKNGGWATHRRGFMEMTGTATAVVEGNVATLEAGGIEPGGSGTMELIADTGKKFSGTFLVGDGTWNWTPGDVSKLQFDFGNIEPVTIVPC